MFSLNRAQIVGNVTRDPEMRYIPSGQAVTSFGVATNRRWRDKDGNNQEQTEFHNIVAWGKLAELMPQLVHKGSKIYVEGRIQTRSWEGQDGGKRNRTEIVMEDFILLTPKGASTSSRADSAGEIPGAKEVKIAPTTEDSEEPKNKKETKKEKTKEDSSSEASAKEEEINLDDIPF